MSKFRIVSILFVILLALFAYFFVNDLIGQNALYALFILYLFTIIIGSLNIDQNFYMTSLNAFSTDKNEVALTFDDGPSEAYTESILQCLKAHDAKANFFLIGKNIAGNEDLLKKLQKDGHLLGSHSYNHDLHLTYKSVEKITEDFQSVNAEIQRTIEKPVRFYRPPYGVTNPHIAKTVKALNMISVGWNVRSFDTFFKSPKFIANRMLSKAEPGSILLFHDSQKVTVEVLNILLPALKSRNYSFLTLDEIVSN